MSERLTPPIGELHITFDRRNRTISVVFNSRDFEDLENLAYRRYENSISIRGDSDFESMDHWDSDRAVSYLVGEAFRLEQYLVDEKLLVRATDRFGAQSRGYRTLIGLPGVVPDRRL